MAEKKEPSRFRKVESHIQANTMRGFLQLIPLLVAVVVVLFIISKTDGYIRNMSFVEGRPWDFTGIGLLVTIAIFYLTGLAGSTGPGRRFMNLKDNVLSSLPVIKTLYVVTRQAVSSLTSSATFSRVVFIEWPREGMVAMGFVTGRAFSSDRSESLVVVYIPTVPNPTSGNMAFVFEDDVVETDITVEDAMKLVFSGGIVLPEVISLARVPREQKPNGLEILGQFRTAADKKPSSPDSP